MKKKMALALCALLLLPALACAEVVSMTELCRQVEEMGRWTQTYEAHGRTIEVDVPVIVPEADRVPILTVKAIDAMNPEKIENNPLLHEAGMLGIMRRVEDEGLYPYLNKQNSSILTEVYYVDGRKTLLIRYNSPVILRGIKPKDFLKYDRTCYYPFELDAKNTYAEENEMSLGRQRYV